MRKLKESELRKISGGSETIIKFGAWLKRQWCAVKNYEAPEKTWKGNGNHVW